MSDENGFEEFQNFILEFFGPADAPPQKISSFWNGLPGECWRAARQTGEARQQNLEKMRPRHRNLHKLLEAAHELAQEHVGCYSDHDCSLFREGEHAALRVVAAVRRFDASGSEEP